MKLELKFHPAADDPGKALAMAVFIAFMGGMLFFVLNSALIVGLLLAAMICSLLRFFLPTYYTLDEKGVAVKWLGRERVYLWEKYRSFTVEKNGVALWTVEDIRKAEGTSKERIAAMRSTVFLLMTPQMIEQAGDILRQKLTAVEKKD